MKELCPNGVEYKLLAQVCDIERGERITKKDISDTGAFAVISGGQQPMGRFSKYNRNENTITISSYGAAGYVGFQTEKFWANDVCLCIYPHNLLNNRYLYHYLTYQQKFLYSKTTKAIPDHIPTQVIKDLQIPVPPIEVQREIVRILDNFTERTEQLIKELTEEITAIKKQYEFYRDKLLSFEKTASNGGGSNCKVVYKTLGEIAKIRNGGDYKSFNCGIFPVYGTGGIMTYIDRYAYDKPTVLIPRKGSIEKIYYVDTPFWNVDTIFYTEIDTNIVLPKYLYYLLKKEHLENYNSAGGVPSLTQSVLNGVKLRIPPLEEQQRIVAILDRFDTLCNDLSQGLPAEIAARKKQYEYYRDRLLTFKEKAV